MTTASQEELFAEFKGNPPADSAAIARCQARLQFPLPSDYVQFLQRMNGGEGFIGQHYLVAWRIENLLDWNEGYRVEESALGLLLFGSDGAGEAFAFDARASPPPVVVVPFILDLRDAVPLAPNFASFLQFLYRSDSLFDAPYRKQQRAR